MAHPMLLAILLPLWMGGPVDKPAAVSILKAALASKALEPYLGERYFSGGRPMLVIGSMLPDKQELKVGKRRFMLYSKLPSDTGRVPAGLNVTSISVDGSTATLSSRLPAEHLGHKFDLRKAKGVWRVVSSSIYRI